MQGEILPSPMIGWPALPATLQPRRLGRRAVTWYSQTLALRPAPSSLPPDERGKRDKPGPANARHARCQP